MMHLIEEHPKTTIFIYSVCLSKTLIFTSKNDDKKLLDYDRNENCKQVSTSILELAIEKTMNGTNQGPELVFLLSSSNIQLEGNVTRLAEMKKKMYVVDTTKHGQFTSSWKKLATNNNHYANLTHTKELKNILEEGNVTCSVESVTIFLSSMIHVH